MKCILLYPISEIILYMRYDLVCQAKSKLIYVLCKAMFTGVKIGFWKKQCQGKFAFLQTTTVSRRAQKQTYGSGRRLCSTLVDRQLNSKVVARRGKVLYQQECGGGQAKSPSSPRDAEMIDN